MEFLSQFLIEVIAVAPGAFIRWCFVKDGKIFSDVLDEDNPYNYVLSWFVILLVMLVVVYLNR